MVRIHFGFLYQNRISVFCTPLSLRLLFVVVVVNRRMVPTMISVVEASSVDVVHRRRCWQAVLWTAPQATCPMTCTARSTRATRSNCWSRVSAPKHAAPLSVSLCLHQNSISTCCCLCQGGYVFMRVCWFVGLSVNKITEKVVDEYSWNLWRG